MLCNNCVKGHHTSYYSFLFSDYFLNTSYYSIVFYFLITLKKKSFLDFNIALIV